MREEKTTADRLAGYSDAFFAVIVTIMVLELRAPDQPVFSALRPLWPTAISPPASQPLSDFAAFYRSTFKAASQIDHDVANRL